MIRKGLVIILMILTLFVGCSNEGIDPNATGSVRITIPAARTLLPAMPDIKSYEVTLTKSGESSVSYSAEFSAEKPIEFGNILIGTYNVSVKGFDSQGTALMKSADDKSITVKPYETTECNITLHFIEEGNGAIRVELSWVDNEITTGPFRDALDRKSLGFLAWDDDNKEALSENAKIQWVQDFSSGSFEYREENIAATSGKNISFKIYSQINRVDTVIAKTFPTTIQVYSSLTSVPDSNEKDNFTIGKGNMVSYIKNVTNPTYSLDSTNPESKINVSWTNPSLSSSAYPIEVHVTIKDNGSEYTETKTVYPASKEGNNSTTFEGLSKDTSYSLSFMVKAATGYSESWQALSDVRTKTPVEKIEFDKSVVSNYNTGDTATIEAIITPEDATNKDYEVTVDNENATVYGKKVTFNSYGDYTVTVTSLDNKTIEAKKKITAKLATPQNLSIEQSDESITLKWDEVKGATSYVIEKKTKSGHNADETITVETNSYTDSELYSASEYSYQVKAIDADGKYASLFSSLKEIKTESADITITEVDIARPDFSLTGKLGYIIAGDGKKGFTLSIAEIVGATNYRWKLNGTVLAEGAYSAGVENITINGITNGLSTDSYETVNTLKLEIELDGKTYSSTSYFYVIEEEIGVPSLMDDDDNRVNYKGENDKSEKLNISFSASPSFTPALIWTSSNDEKVSVDQNGEITFVSEGKATITAEVISTGATATIEIESYVPATGITIDEEKMNHSYIMILEKTGVTLYKEGGNTNRYVPELNMAEYVSVSAADGKTPTSEITWKSFAPSVLEVVDGKLKAKTAGTATITAAIDGYTIEKEFTVLDIDVTVKRADSEEKPTVVTGKEYRIEGNTAFQKDIVYDLSLKFANDYYATAETLFNNSWCFAENGKTELTTLGVVNHRITSNNFTGTIVRKARAEGGDPVEARITDKEGNRIVTLSFTSTP